MNFYPGSVPMEKLRTRPSSEQITVYDAYDVASAVLTKRFQSVDIALLDMPGPSRAEVYRQLAVLQKGEGGRALLAHALASQEGDPQDPPAAVKDTPARRRDSYKWATKELAARREKDGLTRGDSADVARRASDAFNCKPFDKRTLDYTVTNKPDLIGQSPAGERRPRSFPIEAEETLIEFIVQRPWNFCLGLC